MSDNNDLRLETRKLLREYRESIYSEDLTFEDIEAFNKVIYHINKDIPSFETEDIVDIVRTFYDIKPDIKHEIIDLSHTSERRMHARKQHQKKLDNIMSACTNTKDDID